MKGILKFFTICLVLISCTTGKKALERGDYDTAVLQAVDRLRSNDNSKKATSTLKKAYQLSVRTHQTTLADLQLSQDMYKWEKMTYEYRAINRQYEAIRKCPACLDIVPNPVRYINELENASQKAAEVRYNLGAQAMQQKSNRQKAMEAHQHFKAAKDFVPRYKDIDDRLQEALYFATLKVVVEPIPSPSRIFEIRHEFFVNKINEYLHRTAINEYVRFYTPSEAQSQKLEFVDHFIRMEFDQFTLGNVVINNTEREVSKDSVEIGKTSRGEKIYGTVKAKLKISEKSITGGGVLDFKIFDNELKKVISQEKFPSQYVWTLRWASYDGDKRALSNEELEMVNRKELSIPGPQVMFEEFTAPLYDQVVRKISSYYQNGRW